MQPTEEQPSSPRRVNVRALLLGSVAVLLITLVLVGGAAWAWSRGNVMRVGHSLLVGPEVTGDHWLDGSNTQVTVSSQSRFSRNVTIRHAFQQGELSVYQVMRPNPRSGRVFYLSVSSSGPTVPSAGNISSFGGYLLVQE